MMVFPWRKRLKFLALLALFVLLAKFAYVWESKQQAPTISENVEHGKVLEHTVARVELPIEPQHNTTIKNSRRCNAKTNMREEVGPLIKMMDSWHWKYISDRIELMWPHFRKAAHTLCTEKKKCTRIHKKITILPGVLLGTILARPDVIKAGGQVGDLIQWADLIAALYVLGHDLTLERDVSKVTRLLPATEQAVNNSDCHSVPDILYADIIALRKMSETQRTAIRCRIRVVDAYGTQAMFNDKKYAESHEYRSGWGMLNLNLKQFQTFYPHTEDNSFLGFAIPPASGPARPKENLGVLYGKNADYFKGKKGFFGTLQRYMKLVANANYRAAVHLPASVTNLGVVPPQQHRDVMSRAKFLVGLKFPLESTGAIKALASGSVFLNPSFVGKEKDQLRGKPTTRQITSQVSYLEEYVGKPYVLTLNIDNLTEVETVIKQSVNTTVKPWLPHEFTPLGMLERVNSCIDNQDFCNKSKKIWPPLSARQMHKGNFSQSCTQVCKDKGLTCEPVYFETMNTQDTFDTFSLKCDSTTKDDDLYYPAYHEKSKKCTLQGRPLLFSCEGSHTDLERLCPCRDYIKYQIAFCKRC